MKKAGILGGLGLGALVLGMWVGGPVLGQNKGGPPAITRTRVGVVNMQEVFKNYDKVKNFRESLKTKAESYETTFKNKVARLEAADKEYKDPKITQQKKDQLETEMKHLKFEIDELRQKATREINRLQDEQLAIVYGEFDAVVREVAARDGIDLVIRFNEDWDKDTYHKPENVTRRLNQPFWPMHYDPSLNITGSVLAGLNARYAAAAKAGAGVVPAGANNK